jgi:hypothetical protein
MAFLLTQDFPTDVWAMLRRHRRPRLPTAERDPTFPHAHGTLKG